MSNDAYRWQLLQSLFHQALELRAEQRPAFLAAACAGDGTLVRDVQAMLDADARNTSLLDRGVEQVAHQVLDGSVPQLERVGPYQVRGVIGHGGMGVVYLAEREDLGSRAAIKVLRDASLSPARRERFLSEQRTLAQLNHDGIARLYDADALRDGTPYFVMEYVPGVPLTQYCNEQALTIAQRLRLFRDVCDAVQHAHRHAVIHRDLKPSNILVTAEGAIKLLDFGIAKQLESLDTPTDQTVAGLRAMTPAYAAPEQIRGDAVGTYTDVYGLGVILYELLTGRLPFDFARSSPGQAELTILQHDPEKPSAVAARGNEPAPADAGSIGRASWTDLDVVCLTALQKDPQQRYRTVDALARDIDHFLRHEPIEARPHSLGYTMHRFLRRNWRPVAAAAAVAAALIGVVAFYTVRLAYARDTAVVEAERTQRIQEFVLNLFEGGDPSAGPSDTLRVITLVDRGVLQARSLAAEPRMRADLYETLGGIYQKLGNLARADTLLSVALEERQNLFGDEHADVARSLVALGLLRADQAQLEEAEKLVREGLDMSKRALPPSHPGIAGATTALGTVLQHRGSYDDAIATLQESLRLLANRGPADMERSHTLLELANTYFYAGNYPASDSLNRQLLATSRELYGANHPSIADALINLSAVQFQLGNYPEAETYLRQALDIFRTFHGPEHYETAAAMNMLGQSLVFQGRYDEALDLLRQALVIRERTYGPSHPRVASTLSELGTAAYQQGDLDAAAAYYIRMGDIYREVYGGKHYLMGIAISNLASVRMAAGELPAAERLFREAIALYLETLPPDHVTTAVARIKLGRAILRQGRHADAEPITLAGYDILVKQANPSVSYLKAAREDLIAVYEALNRPDQLARIRADLEKATAQTASR